jgi:hypothetical protein
MALILENISKIVSLTETEKELFLSIIETQVYNANTILHYAVKSPNFIILSIPH